MSAMSSVSVLCYILRQTHLVWVLKATQLPSSPAPIYQNISLTSVASHNMLLLPLSQTFETTASCQPGSLADVCAIDSSPAKLGSQNSGEGFHESAFLLGSRSNMGAHSSHLLIFVRGSIVNRDVVPQTCLLGILAW